MSTPVETESALKPSSADARPPSADGDSPYREVRYEHSNNLPLRYFLSKILVSHWLGRYITRIREWARQHAN